MSPVEIAAGQTWRIRGIDGPSRVFVRRVLPAARRERQSIRGRRLVLEHVDGAAIHPDDWRERDLTDSPNAELVSTCPGRG
jgi:hypothetical protein